MTEAKHTPGRLEAAMAAVNRRKMIEAAAPDMLAALQELAKFYGWNGDESEYTPCRMAVAAIAKATGAV